MGDRVRHLARVPFDLLGWEIHRRAQPMDIAESASPDRQSLTGVLHHLRSAELAPATIIDVGAARGSFTKQAYGIFPEARLIMIEPLNEYIEHLSRIVRAIPKATRVAAAATKQVGTTTINVHPDLFGSSLYLESEESDVNGKPRAVPAVTVDDVCDAWHTSGPYLLKLDVQGAELDVLAGASKTLENTDVILMEVSLFEFFNGGPQFADVIAYMKRIDFVPYDVFGFQHRLLDGALSQVDMVFVRESGRLRVSHRYATREQREAQTRDMRALMAPVPQESLV